MVKGYSDKVSTGTSHIAERAWRYLMEKFNHKFEKHSFEIIDLQVRLTEVELKLMELKKK